MLDHASRTAGVNRGPRHFSRVQSRARPTLAHCQTAGVGPEMFGVDAEGAVTCTADAVSCLIGRPATEDHVAICESLVMSASSIDKGKNIAVATLLAAAHSCE